MRPHGLAGDQDQGPVFGSEVPQTARTRRPGERAEPGRVRREHGRNGGMASFELTVQRRSAAFCRTGFYRSVRRFGVLEPTVGVEFLGSSESKSPHQDVGLTNDLSCRLQCDSSQQASLLSIHEMATTVQLFTSHQFTSEYKCYTQPRKSLHSRKKLAFPNGNAMPGRGSTNQTRHRHDFHTFKHQWRRFKNRKSPRLQHLIVP